LDKEVLALKKRKVSERNSLRIFSPFSRFLFINSRVTIRAKRTSVTRAKSDGWYTKI